WHPDDGGDLVLFDPATGAALRHVQPLAGTLVIFMSALIPHEVEASRRARLSIAGWFRRDAVDDLPAPP
ncbi:MAG TPA: 2OG-Fe(II) oxygenase, partial [Pseudomonadales bacterium]|nr:2OG-Fe(II) oxygenase [Pseudomonadales bacterium]